MSIERSNSTTDSLCIEPVVSNLKVVAIDQIIDTYAGIDIQFDIPALFLKQIRLISFGCLLPNCQFLASQELIPESSYSKYILIMDIYAIFFQQKDSFVRSVLLCT